MALVMTLVGMAAVPPARAIVGGTAGGPQAASSVMVLIEGGGLCTGVVLSREIVLTAAHCVPRGKRSVVLAERAPPVLLEPAQVVIHPDYRPNATAERRRSIDLALIRLGTALPGSLVPAQLSVAKPVRGDRVTVAGLGTQIEGDPQSSGTYRSVALAIDSPHGESRWLLWAAAAGRAGACRGDSGGPIFDADDNVVAITSWSVGRKGAACGHRTQGVLLGSQRGWIDGQMARWQASARWAP